MISANEIYVNGTKKAKNIHFFKKKAVFKLTNSKLLHYFLILQKVVKANNSTDYGTTKSTSHGDTY